MRRMDGKRALTRGMQIRLSNAGADAPKLDIWMNNCGDGAIGQKGRVKFDPDNPGGEYKLDLGDSYDNAIATELAQMARQRPENVVWTSVLSVALPMCRFAALL